MMPAEPEAASDPRLRDELLADPAVQESLVRAGKKALQDPAVQEQVLKTAQAKGPQAAEQAARQISEWASDPEVQQKARERAFEAASGAAVMAKNGPAHFVGLIEQGPTGVRMLAFYVGAASVVRSLWNVIWVFSVFFAPVSYFIDVYQAFFGIVIMLFEADPDLVQRLPKLNRIQDNLIENTKMLSCSWGRGAFYVFMGLIWLSEVADVFQHPITFLIGAALVFIGGLHWAMHFGIMPHHFVQKVRDGSAMAVYYAASGLDSVRIAVQKETDGSQQNAVLNNSSGANSPSSAQSTKTTPNGGSSHSGPSNEVELPTRRSAQV